MTVRGSVTVPVEHLTTAGRLLSKVAVNKHGCWIFTGSWDKSGYGHFRVGGKKGRVVSAHRVSYTIFKGDPGELHVMHECDVRACVNPEHLKLGTHQDNMADCATKGRNRTPRPRGKRVFLTPEQVKEAVDLFHQTGNMTAAAKQYGLTATGLRYHVKKLAA